MLMDWKTQYCQDVHSPKIDNLDAISIKIPGEFYRTSQADSKVDTERQSNYDSQKILKWTKLKNLHYPISID